MKKLNEALVTLGIQDFQTDDLDAVKNVVDTLQASNIELEDAPVEDSEPEELDFEKIATDLGLDSDEDVEDEGDYFDVDVDAVEREDEQRATEQDDGVVEESKMLTEDDDIEPSENIIADLIQDGNTTADDVDEAIRECCELIGESVENVDFDKIHSLLSEDTVKQGSSWVNKGKEGTHGKFKTKKEADAQRKAMFASGYKGETVDHTEVVITDTELDKILDKANEVYKFLYDNGDNVAGYNEAVAAYDEFAKNPEFIEMVRRLAAKRGDYFSSDREIGALMFALDSFGFLGKFEAVPLMEINEAAEAGETVSFVEMYTKLNDGDLNGYREDLLKLSEDDKKDYAEWATNNGIPAEDLRLYMGLNETSNPDCNFGTTPNSYLKDCNATPCKMTRYRGFADKTKENEGFPLRKDDGLAPKIVAIKESAENMLANAKTDGHKQAIIRRMADKLLAEGVSYSEAIKMLSDK